MGAFTRSEILLGLMAGAIGAAIVALPTYWSANRQMDVKMVEIAVGILSQEPKESIAPAREWAVDVIERNANVTPSQEVRDALVNYRAVINFGSVANSYDYGGGGFQEDGALLRTPAPAN